MKYDLIFAGVAIVDSLIKGFDPEPISKSGFRAESGALHVGGEAVNGSMAAAKLGMKTAILCHLGKDEAGDMIRGALVRSGVDVSLIASSGEHPTPVTTMFVHEDGTRRSITNGAHRYNFHPERYADCFGEAKGIVLGSLFRAPFDDPDVIGEVLKQAKERDLPVFADTKLPNFRFLTLEDLKESLPLIDYITPNEDEARYYTEKDTPEEMADVFLGYGVKNVLIKLGGEGCFFKNPDIQISLPALPIDAVDATGAGDNFLAGFASEIIRGASIEEALYFANACGAVCTTAVGAGTALTGRAQVEEFMKKYNQ